MDKNKLFKLLNEYKEEKVDFEKVYENLQMLPYEDLGYAKLDHHRAIRKNYPEVIFCQGKSHEQMLGIFQSLIRQNQIVMGTRANKDMFDKLKLEIPDLEYHQNARIIYYKKEEPQYIGDVVVLSAGTSDLAVADEAAFTLELMGVRVNRYYDVGVAGIHRLLDKLNEINKAQVVIVVAGMEGALASVVGGLTSRPVIAVPTSIGYGASFNGLAALLAMLNSCASGVGVVNIDNGFGAATLAFSIVNTIKNG